MKLLTHKEAQIVSGGATFRIHKQSVELYAEDMSSHCVASFQSLLNAVDANYDQSGGVILKTIGPYLDNIANSGCAADFHTLRTRADAAGVTK
ncbi:MAG: hypothetical protein AB7I18_03890 [Candidatus Berkiella sp.]